MKYAEEPCFKISIIFASATSLATSLATSPAIPLAIPLRIFKSILVYSVFGLRSSEDGSGTAIVSLKLIASYTSSYTSSYVSSVINLSKSSLMSDKFHSTESRFISSCKTQRISRHNAMWPQYPNIINDCFG